MSVRFRPFESPLKTQPWGVSTAVPFLRALHSTPPAPKGKGKMPPKKKNEEVKKVMLGRPGNNMKVRASSDLSWTLLRSC